MTFNISACAVSLVSIGIATATGYHQAAAASMVPSFTISGYASHEPLLTTTTPFAVSYDDNTHNFSFSVGSQGASNIKVITTRTIYITLPVENIVFVQTVDPLDTSGFDHVNLYLQMSLPIFSLSDGTYHSEDNIPPSKIHLAYYDKETGQNSVGEYLLHPTTYNISDFSLSPSTVPLPASAPMFGAALLALGAAGCGLKRKKAAAA